MGNPPLDDEYTPIYFANQLTAPILIEHGAIIDFVKDYQLIDEYVDLMRHCSIQDNDNLDIVDQMIDWLLSIHKPSMKRYEYITGYKSEDEYSE